MQENQLVKTCIITTIIGLILLIILSDKLEPDSIKISDIDKKQINKMVTVQAQISQITFKNDILSGKIKDNSGQIDLVAFDAKGISIRKGDLIQVQGKVSFYKDKPQINADKIIKIS
jgi:DNA/RNA endonuclease YhcR with UshA esterase domain